MARQLSDEIAVSVISFLTVAAGVIGLVNLLGGPSLSLDSFLTFVVSAIALVGGIQLARFEHLGWLLSLIVIAVSEVFILVTHVVVNRGLDPLFFVIFTLFYATQAYYLVSRRHLFNYPHYHSRYQSRQ